MRGSWRREGMVDRWSLCVMLVETLVALMHDGALGF